MTTNDEMIGILRDFVAESRAALQEFELRVLEIEGGAPPDAFLPGLFRTIHSLKGSAGFLDLPRLERLAHAGESLLARARDGGLEVGPGSTQALLSMVDGIRLVLEHVDRHHVEPDVDLSPVVARLESVDPGAGETGVEPVALLGEAVTAGRDGVRDGKIRVDVRLLDKLMNLVGELVLARNQIVELSHQDVAPNLASACQRLSLVTSELQEAVMKTRMQPIANVWVRLPRLVRDLAQPADKRIRLVTEGAETELDKTIIEAIHDPLIHLVRNAVDHGIESPAVRAAAGKPEEGTLRLRAFHEGGMVNIELADDGAGIDPAAVRERVVAAGVLGAELAAQMSDRDLLALVFAPGVSTAARVTSVSGRGVGMDVVKTEIERVGGTVDLQSRPGQGTTIRIKIPLTLAIIPALIVTAAGERYAIPQASVVEVVMLDGESARRDITLVQGAPVLRLRGELLPLVHLDRELGLREAPAEAAESAFVVVLRADQQVFGLAVDGIRDTEEIVVKPLWQRLGALACYAGATVMGDGRVALILDTIGLAQRIGAGPHDTPVLHVASAETTPRESGRSSLALLCRTPSDGRLAIPLSEVARLEELPADRVERPGPTEVVQYRGRILPLVHVARVVGGEPATPAGGESGGPAATLKVVVYSRGDHSVGLVVDDILDIVEIDTALESPGARPGVLGSMTVNDRVTELLDVEDVIRLASPVETAPGMSVGGEA